MTDFMTLGWYTDLDLAITEARRTRKPILSLRLLGKLPDALTCANSRFFKRVLYPEPRIRRILMTEFVLHWESVRPVPIVTLDFGNGRRITKTITGNSAHVVLDPDGRVVDAIPGLVTPDVFIAQLEQARMFALADRRGLARMHARAAATPPPMQPSPTRARGASMLAMAKHRVEVPVLEQIEPTDIERDTQQNLALHRQIHEAFAYGGEWSGVEGFVEWLYADVFRMPLHDPALGLDVPDPFADIDYATNASSHASAPPRLTAPPRSNRASS